MTMYYITTRWTGKVVYTTTTRALALLWLEENNDPAVFKLVSKRS